MPKSLASAHSGGSMRFCTTMGGELIRLSCRKCQKVAPSWSGFFGAPLGVVLPSATRPARASWNSLVSSAGRSSTTPSISPGPGFPSECGTPAGTTIVSPAPATRCSPLRVKWASPARMVNRSSWPGWICSVITPPGTLRQLKRTSCPWLSSAMAVYSIHSPVAGLKKGRKPVTGRSATDMIIGPSAEPRRTGRGGTPDAREVMEAGRGGAQEQDAGGDARGHGERRARHGGDENDWPGGQRPSNDAVAADMDQVVEPEQQRPDCDHDGRQDPVGAASSDDDDGQHERCDQFDDGGEGH